MAGGRKIGVVLFQLGGPDSLEAVEPFLFNLFSDPEIIDFPFARLARPTLAKLVARNRAGKVRHHYKEIGGRSPISELTKRQARALEQELRRTADAKVWVAMRYWHPLTEEVVREVAAAQPDELVLLPLYPQYSKVTTGSSLKEWERRAPHPSVPKNSGNRPERGARLGTGQAKEAGWEIPTRTVAEFYREPLYLDALVENINGALARFPSPEPVALVFSAHGVPLSVIESGDPYCRQTGETVELVMQRGGWKHPHQLCYQSRVGPGRWTEPMLHSALQSVRASGATRVLVAPISFVTEHIETLYEIDIEAREQAAKLGFEQFEMMPALNDSPKFIACLADLVLKAVEKEDKKAMQPQMKPSASLRAGTDEHR
ncbi:MAG: ferrochelatase [Acidobacteria bacterium]|nr:ferrochelatase [Acidobacteriota bacterium]